ncbi:MAG: hypothetical protein U9Q22_08130 [Candidatus Altiarchaeota archaeon]|nr:hypothetical protein [Candidatus Altiarchaeota archaeon]
MVISKLKMTEVNVLLKEIRRRNLMKRGNRLLPKRNPELKGGNALVPGMITDMETSGTRGNHGLREDDEGGLSKLTTPAVSNLKIPRGRMCKVAESNVALGEGILQKEAEKRGSDIFVYLTMVNTGSKLMKDIQVIDTLPDDATNLVVFTPGNLSERLGQSLIWEVSSLDRGVKKIFHYKMSSDSDEIPAATSRWIDNEFNGFKDFDEMALRVNAKKC